MNALSPLLLQAQISPPPGGGSFGLADSTLLENPHQGPLWLDEIRIRMPRISAGSSGQSWSSLRIELKLGSYSLTNGFVPLSLLGKILNDTQVVGEQGGAGNSPDIFTWKLPKPLWIPERALLRPTLYFEPYSGSPTAVPVTIIYACRPLARGTPTPRKLQIPWVTYFKPPYLKTPSGGGATDTINTSTPADLFNPFETELHVQRFVGRLMGQNLGEEQTHMSLASANINLATGALTTGTLVSAQDSMNNILIRDRTPFAHVFDFLDRAWTVNCTLPSKGFYLFTVERLWNAYAPAEDFTATVGISMVGWREVAL